MTWIFDKTVNDNPLIHFNLKDNVQNPTAKDIYDKILLMREQKNIVKNDLKKVQYDLKKYKLLKILSYVLLYGFIIKNYIKNISQDIENQELVIEQLQNQLENFCLEAHINWNYEQQISFVNLNLAFQALSRSAKNWDITYRAGTRNSYNELDKINYYEGLYNFKGAKTIRRNYGHAQTFVLKTSVRFQLKEFEEIKCNHQPFYIPLSSTFDIYIYPTFVLFIAKDRSIFKIVDINDIKIEQFVVNFIEADVVPIDSIIVGNTWITEEYLENHSDYFDQDRHKISKNVPLVQYGGFTLKGKDIFNKEYQFSNVIATEKFAEAFMRYQVAIKIAL